MQCPLELGHYDLLKLGHDEFATIEVEEMGGGKKVAHTGETDFTVVYICTCRTVLRGRKTS